MPWRSPTWPAGFFPLFFILLVLGWFGAPCAAFTPHEQLLNLLHDIAATPPPADPDPTCTAPTLPPPVCTGSAFNGEKLPSPRRVYSMFLLGFEVDTLEILFHEQAAYVDLFCVVESTRAHFNQSTKPLVWERLKWTERFAFVAPKVVHVVFDDGEVGRFGDTSDLFRQESRQAEHGARECSKAISEKFGYRPDDVLISASADEILADRTLSQLQWCHLPHPVVGSAIWMPAGGDLQRAVAVDHHPIGMLHAHILPTIYKLSVLRWFGQCSDPACYPGLRLFKPLGIGGYVTGGVHLSWAPFLPHVYLKELTATSYHGGQHGSSFWLRAIHEAVDTNSVDQLQLAIPDNVFPGKLIKLAGLAKLEKEIVHTPWFLKCNPNRFPYWFRKPDPRNTEMRELLQRPDVRALTGQGPSTPSPKLLLDLFSGHASESARRRGPILESLESPRAQRAVRPQRTRFAAEARLIPYRPVPGHPGIWRYRASRRGVTRVTAFADPSSPWTWNTPVILNPQDSVFALDQRALVEIAAAVVAFLTVLAAVGCGILYRVLLIGHHSRGGGVSPTSRGRPTTPPAFKR